MLKGTMILFLVAVFLLVIVAYLTQETAMGKRFGSKAYHMLLLGLMKIDLAASQGARYFHLLLESVFKGYRVSGLDAERIERKRQRMSDYRMRSQGGAEYTKKKNYNRKILES